jgi:hypothetical protein
MTSEIVSPGWMTKSKDIPRLPDAMMVTTLSIAIISHPLASPHQAQ